MIKNKPFSINNRIKLINLNPLINSCLIKRNKKAIIDPCKRMKYKIIDLNLLK